MNFISKLVFIISIFVSFSLKTFAETPEEKYNKRAAKIIESRSKPTSSIFYDTRIKANKEGCRQRYVYRSKSKSENKISKSFKPQAESPNLQNLGVLGCQRNHTDKFQFRLNSDLFTQLAEAEDRVTALELDQLYTFKKLGFGFILSKRKNNYNLKVYNYQRPFADQFKNPQFLDYNSKWRVKALFIEGEEELEVASSNGTKETETSYGKIYFLHQGELYWLRSYGYSRKESQVRFSDDHPDMYGGGRYLYVLDKDLYPSSRVFSSFVKWKKSSVSKEDFIKELIENSHPDEEAITFWLDFNFSYDPPCAYSQAYHCSLPRYDEHLPFILDAGKLYPRAY